MQLQILEYSTTSLILSLAAFNTSSLTLAAADVRAGFSTE